MEAGEILKIFIRNRPFENLCSDIFLHLKSLVYLFLFLMRKLLWIKNRVKLNVDLISFSLILHRRSSP